VPRTAAVDSIEDILPAYTGTPVEWLLRYHNLAEPLPSTSGRAQLLVGICMDDRKDLVVRNEFAFVLRAAGGNLRDHAFDVSYAVAIGGVTTIALLAHTDCGMVGVRKKRPAFILGLVARGGWDEGQAAALLVAPLLYRVEDDRLLQIVE
jgi:carbonic anhydrase